MKDSIEVVGADANNLKRVSVTIPRNALTAIVGVSGSGKSSLVEDTIAAVAAERMHRFLDIDQPALRGAHVDAFVGALPPMLFAGQRAFRGSVRTTLGTSTGLLRLLRRLFVRFGKPFADDVEEPVPDPSPETFSAWLERYASGPAIVWASPVVNQRTDGVAAVERLRKAGVDEIVVRSETDRGAKVEQGARIAIAKFKPLRDDVLHSIEARIADVHLGQVSSAGLERILAQAWSAAPGAVFVELRKEERPELRRAFAFGLDARVHRVHPKSPIVYAKPDAHLLSFNAPKQLDSGACPTCDGLGVATGLDEKELVTHPERSMHEGAFALWTKKNYRYVNIQHVTIEGLRGRDGFDPDLPWRKLAAAARKVVLEGTPDRVQGIDPRTKKKSGAPMEFVGFRRAIVERVARNTSATKELKTFIGEGACPACNGTRWSVQARALRVGGWSIDRLLALPLTSLENEGRGGSLSKKCPAEARSLVANVGRTAASMVSVGLGHLSGDRGMLDVSDGESRRTRLAGVLTSRLAGLLLVLDEPARGLHEQDLVSLGDALVDATELHTVIISEHRQRIIARADHVVELGPGAGPAGGKVTSDGPVAGTDWAQMDRVSPRPTRAKNSDKWLRMDGVHIHNVQGATVRIPLGAITCIAGVSGSGKSSFARGALVPALMRVLPKDQVDADDFRTRRGTWTSVQGAEGVEALYALDQAPAAAQKRSLAMTFLDVADRIRRAYASQPEARGLGFKAADFSTNGGRGRCPRCLGLGRLDDDEECPVCGGLRFGIDALAVRLGGVSYGDLLATPIDGLLQRKLPPEIDPEVMRSMVELGVGHLCLGRSLDTLSGGEVQRMRIARALTKHKVRKALFVLDEPAGGLHPADVKRLDAALRHIVEAGNTVVLVEHDPHLLATCDHIVEFGPGSGLDGGRVIAEGSPEEIRGGETPTGLALKGLPRPHKHHPSGSAKVTRGPLTLGAALRARAEIRQILGEDVQVPEDDDEVVAPSAILRTPDGERRPLEIADLDSAVLSVLLDAVRPDVEALIENAANAWDMAPLQLVIHPLLDAMATWGRRIPASVTNEVQAHRAAMGLSWLRKGETDPSKIRATGARFDVRASSPETRRMALRDALAVGGGYLELIDSRGKVHHRVSERLMDLDAGLVGPRHATPAHFRRLDRGGACPMCRGKTTVAHLDRDLLVAQERGTVLDEKCLDERAFAILKGVWRSEVTPFFRRLADEGLWSADARWSSMDAADEATAMHGFWIRPSHGTFLKSGSKNDGSEVGHWLRWDGLVSAIDGQLERSKDSGWRDAVNASRREVRCPMCGGTGLGPSAALLEVGGKTLDGWMRGGSVDAFMDALEALRLPPRAVRERKRVVHCIAPLRSSKVPLGRPALGPEAEDVLRRACDQFAAMPLVAELGRVRAVPWVR
jgi:excinuclease ABC A subunit